MAVGEEEEDLDELIKKSINLISDQFKQQVQIHDSFEMLTQKRGPIEKSIGHRDQLARIKQRYLQEEPRSRSQERKTSRAQAEKFAEKQLEWQRKRDDKLREARDGLQSKRVLVKGP